MKLHHLEDGCVSSVLIGRLKKEHTVRLSCMVIHCLKYSMQWHHVVADGCCSYNNDPFSYNDVHFNDVMIIYSVLNDLE